MATITKRKNSNGTIGYLVQVRIKGAKAVTKTFPMRREAERWAAQTETEIREGRYFNKAATRHTVAEAIDDYVASLPQVNQTKHMIDVCAYLHYWKNEIGHYYIDDLNPHCIEVVQKKLSTTISVRTKQYFKAATVRYYMLALSNVFTYICRTHTHPVWMPYNIMQNVKKIPLNNARTHYLKSYEDGSDELERLLKACDEIVMFRKRNNTLAKSPGSLYLSTIVRLALFTGLRSGEIKKLKWQDVNLDNGTLYLHHTKNGESYTIALGEQAIELLREHSTIRRIDSDYLFPSRDGTTAVDWSEPFKEAVLFAGLKGFHFHDLRHTYISYAAMNGATAMQLKDLARHKSINSTVRYTHLSAQSVRDVAQSMLDKHFPKQLHAVPKAN